jgi:hypothetical protein
MPRLSLGLGVQAVSKVKGGGGAPTTLPLSTATLYFSGLTFADTYGGSDGFYFDNPYSKYVQPPDLLWRGNNFNSFFSQLSWQSLVGWSLTCACYDGDGQPASLQCASNSANGTAIPLTGWQYTSGLVLSGTLIISTTP